MDRNHTSAIRISIEIIFFWGRGILKFFSGVSPAEGLAIKSIDLLTFGLFSDQLIIYGLASVETLIGLASHIQMVFENNSDCTISTNVRDYNSLDFIP